VPPFTRPAAARAPVALTFTRKSMAPGEGHMFQTAKRHYNQQEKKERKSLGTQTQFGILYCDEHNSSEVG
jgi:hypothetical protein